MNWGSALLWGFAATVALTSIMAISRGMRLTRFSFPLLLGTIVTNDRDRARAVGMLIHVINGLLFALLYAAAFEAWDRATWWIGAIVGLVQSVFVLTALMPILPGLHPRMASETSGPTTSRFLEPPGSLARNYGLRTPAALIIAHLAFGAVLGAFYAL